MLRNRLLILSTLALSFFFLLPTSSTYCQAAKKRYIERKSMKFNVGEIVLADIPIASRLGVSYEFLLDRNFGIMIGMAYLGYPVSMWGSDSLSRAWRSNIDQKGYNVDCSFRHYFNDADESGYYFSTFFSSSRLWIDGANLPAPILMRKDRIALVLGYQRRWRFVYFDFSGGLGVKIKNWKTHLQQMPTYNSRLSPDYTTSLGWSFEFNKPVTTLAVPFQFLLGFRF